MSAGVYPCIGQGFTIQLSRQNYEETKLNIKLLVTLAWVGHCGITSIQNHVNNYGLDHQIHNKINMLLKIYKTMIYKFFN